jgi:hypothetical protein
VDLSLNRRRLVRIAAVAVVVIAVVVGFHLYPRTGADRVQHLISWRGCESITRDTPGPQSAVHAWTTARERVLIQCNDLGPNVLYARFSDVAARKAALRQAPPPGPYCQAGREVVLNGLDSGFSALCRDLHGRLVTNRNPAPTRWRSRCSANLAGPNNGWPVGQPPASPSGFSQSAERWTYGDHAGLDASR